MISSKPFKWVLVVAITLLAAFFRLHKIDVLPPGDTYDAAYYGLDALAILRGERPIYFETNHGREPLFSYLVAGCVAALGVGSMAIHVASAVVGIATVPAVYLAAEDLFAEDEGWLGKFGGLAAALATALSFWHLGWSRYGVRAILTPLFAALTLCLLWRGLRSRRWLPFAGCGMLLGLGMYTYQASYLLLVLVVVSFAFATWRTGAWNKRTFFHLATVTLLALLVFAPLGIYYLTHPDSSLERVKQVNIFQETDVLSTVQVRLRSTWLVFGIEGDTTPRTNLPGRPALNPFYFASFVLGIAISLWRIKQTAFFVLLAWLGVMCLPSVLALHAEIEKRIIGSLPAVMMLIAAGLLAPLELVWRWAKKRVQGKRLNATAAAAVSLAIVTGFAYSGVQTYQDYFVAWGEDPALFTHHGVGQAAIGKYISNLPVEEKIYVSPIYVGHPSLVYNARARSGLRGYHGDYCMVLPYQVDHGVTYIVVPGEDQQSLGRLHSYLPQGTLSADGPLHYQQPYFVSYHVPVGARAHITPTHELEASWADQIQLLGYDVAYDEQESRITIHSYYRALRAMDTDYTIFVQLIGPPNPVTGSPLWSQYDSEPCRRYRPTSTWDTDEILIDDYELIVPADRIPGETYELIMGFYDWRTLERLTVLDARRGPVGDHLVLEPHVFHQ